MLARASFFMFERRFENGKPIPLFTGEKDPTGSIALAGETDIRLAAGEYLVIYSVSAVLEQTGYMQLTPAYNGAANLVYGAYFKTGASYSSACGANSFLLRAPAATSLTFTWNSSTASRSGAATVSVLKLAGDA